MNNEQCKGCLVYENRDNKNEILYMNAYCGFSKDSICPCFYCLVKAMCTDACPRFRDWRVEQPYISNLTIMGRFQ